MITFRSPARVAKVALVLAATCAVAGTARAACPAAWSPTRYDVTTGVVRWCAPELNAAGQLHAVGELARCDWTFVWSGSAPVTVSEPSPTPGQEYAIAVPQARGLGSVQGVCYNVLGTSGTSTGVVATAFLVGAPDRPLVIP